MSKIQFRVYCKKCSKEMASDDIKTVGDKAIVEKILEETNLAIAIYTCTCKEKAYLLVKKNKQDPELEVNKYYHIFNILDGEVIEKLNVSKDDVNSYLSECTLQEIEYGRVKIFSSADFLVKTDVKIDLIIEM